MMVAAVVVAGVDVVVQEEEEDIKAEAEAFGVHRSRV